jgi:anaerobic magnesium-protoporphyrin IX monomethyl ester cyclase
MARIALLQLNEYELHGLESLAAVLTARGHERRLIVPGFERDPMGAIVSFDPDVVGIGLTTVERQEALLWARALKKHTRARVVLGGIDPTFFPELAREPGVDAVVRGEAELALAELMDRVDRGEEWDDIPGLSLSRGGELIHYPVGALVADLDTLPFPDKELYLGRYRHFRDFPIKVFMASRGCPHHCTYCANRGLRALYPDPEHYVRFKSPEYLIEELKSVLARWPARTICFNDDLFTLKISWLREFLPRYRREIAIPFFCCARIDAMTDEKAALLKAAGCYSCWYGLESANPATRELALGRRMGNDAIRQGVEVLHRHGISTLSFNIMNIPGETFADGLATLRFNRELGNEYVIAALFQPFPGAELTARLLAEGKLRRLGPEAGRETMSYFNFSPFTQPDTARLHNLQKLFLLGHWRPGLLPALTRLCALPRNPLFDLVFLATFAVNYGQSHRMSAWEVVYYNLRHVFSTYRAKGRSVPVED